jgi:hypothetical protein
MSYYLIIALQAYCLYHFFKNRTQYYWVFLIIFVPLIGCAIYLITQVYNKRDAEKIQSDIVSIINPTKKVRDLEKRLEFADTFQNRVNLADAYLEIKDYPNAIIHYKKALEDNIQNDVYVIKQLIEALYSTEDNKGVIHYAEKIENHSEFKKSRAQFVYGLALEKESRFDEAEEHLRQIDARYSFYEERLVLAKFLLNRNKMFDAKEIINEIFSESQYMTKQNQKLNRLTIAEVERMRAEF